MADGREKLRAWTLVDELVLEIYGMTRRIPAEGPADLPAAMRGSVVRSALRIVQGVHGRGSDFDESLHAALGSLAELRYYLYLARRLGLIDLRRYRASCAQHERVQKFLRALLPEAAARSAPAPVPGGSLFGESDLVSEPSPAAGLPPDEGER